ncbi:MAG: hypothetical protein KBC74_00690 [Candidatus Pacebacteria bacterium]|nr:hypothetical protein [Candidatus Paceibacterota bacterium]MBP9832030.1 hypothetical protein [Candidatus Paceibacterota bacterium]
MFRILENDSSRLTDVVRRKERRKFKSARRQSESASEKKERLLRHVKHLKASIGIYEARQSRFREWLDAGDTSKNLHLIPYSIELLDVKMRRLWRALRRDEKNINSLQ